MPFKIVQTFERGRTFLSCVPSPWETANILLWPKRGSKKLQKNENSVPAEDWISTPCQLKRSDLSYEEAQTELVLMQSQNDTEEELLMQRKRHAVNITDMNDVAQQCMAEKENISALETSDIADPAGKTAQGLGQIKFIVNPAENPTVVLPDTPIIVGQEPESETVYYITDSNVLQETEPNLTVEDRLQKIENLQENILNKLSTLSTNIHEFLRNTHQHKITSAIGFKPIDNILDLQDLDDALKQKDCLHSFKEKLSLVCGAGKGRGPNNCYTLADVMFTRRFLTECSWAGGSKNAEAKKFCFKAYHRVINLFFEVIQHSDKTFTLLECEAFFKNILKNSVRRNTAKMLRASATKIRVKGKGKGKNSSQSIAPTQPVLNPSDPIPGTSEQVPTESDF